MVDISTGSGFLTTPGEFRIGSAINRTFSILGRHAGPILVLAAVAALPYLYFYLVMPSMAPVTPGPNAAAQQMANFRRAFSSLSLIVPIGAVLHLMCQACLIQLSFQAMLGRPVAIGETLRVGLGRFLPIIGLLILEGVGYFFGATLLFVPFLILVTMWYAALPACVVERLGPVASLGRSARLTKGYRWKLFGLLVLIAIAGAIVGGLIGGISALVGGKTGGAIGQYLVQVISLGFGAVLVAVVYHDLRIAKEGVDTETIAAVFD